MSDQSPFPEADPSESPNITQMRAAYEAEKASRKAAEDQLAVSAATAKENAFLRAGVDLESPMGRLMFDGYKGDIEVDKIKEFVSEIGPQTPASSTPTAEEREQQRLREGLVGDAPPPPVEEVADPWEEGFTAFRERVDRGASRENAAAEVFDRVITAAVNGDPRALYEPERWREEHAAL